MKRYAILFCLMTSFVWACTDTPDTEEPDKPNPKPSTGETWSVNGNVQKGPFVQGTSITISALDEQLNPTGQNYQTKTSDDTGTFLIDNKIESRYVEIIAQGYYFNEIEGKVSSSPLTLRSISDLNEKGKTNINLLTTLEADRIRVLLKEGMSMTEARQQAETELFAVFNIPNTVSADSGFDKLDITQGADANGILLAISASLQAGRSVGELSEIINKIASEVASSGEVESDLIKEKIRSGCMLVNADKVRRNLEARYRELGVKDFTIPPFEDYLDINGDGVIDKNGSWIIIGKRDYDISDEGGVVRVELQYNKEYDVIIEDAPWVGFEPETKAYLKDAVLSFRVQPNPDYDARYAVVKVKDKETAHSESFTISQKQKDAIIVSKNSVELEKESGVFEIEYKHNVTVRHSVDADWIREEGTRAMTSSTVLFACDANPEVLTRTGHITFTAGELSETVTVYQKGGRTIVLSDKEITIDPRPTVVEFTVSANVDFEVTGPDADWIRMTDDNVTKAVVAHRYTYSVEQNNTGSERKAVIVFGDKESDLSEQICITQKPYELLTVTVSTPGTLGTVISTQELHDALMLKICGTLNDDDLKLLYGGKYIAQGDLAGSEPSHIECDWNVETLDLSEMKSQSDRIGYDEESDFFCYVPSLQKVIMPRDLGYIGVRSFNSCANLRTIEFVSGCNTKTIAGRVRTTGVIGYIKNTYSGAFKDCPSLESVTIPASVENFKAGAFMDCVSLKTVRFEAGSSMVELYPSTTSYSSGLSTTTIVMGQLWGCTSLETIELPSSLRIIHSGAFFGTPFRTVTIPESAKYSDMEYMFEDCDRLEAVNLPSFVTVYSKGMFSGCKSLETINTASVITKYCNDCFAGCKAKWVKLDPSIEYEDYVFQNMSDLKSVSFPPGFKTIPYGMFYNCQNLRTIDLGEVEVIGRDAFAGCPCSREFTIPETVTRICEGAFSGTQIEIERLTIRSANLMYEANCFGGDNLKTLVIGNTVRKFYQGGWNVGANSNSVSEIIFEDGSICEYFGFPASEITSISLPPSIKALSSHAFYYCENLVEVDMPAGLSSIGEKAFNNCTALTEITVPYTVTYIGNAAFNSCRNLEKFHIKAVTPPALGENGKILNNTREWLEIYVPDAAVEQYKSSWSLYADKIVGGEPEGQDPAALPSSCRFEKTKISEVSSEQCVFVAGGKVLRFENADADGRSLKAEAVDVGGNKTPAGECVAAIQYLGTTLMGDTYSDKWSIRLNTGYYLGRLNASYEDWFPYLANEKVFEWLCSDRPDGTVCIGGEDSGGGFIRAAIVYDTVNKTFVYKQPFVVEDSGGRYIYPELYRLVF